MPSERPETTKKPNTALTVIRHKALNLLNRTVHKGTTLLNAAINTWAELEKYKDEYSKWNTYNVELLRRIFTDDSLVDEYNMGYERARIIDVYNPPTLADEVKEYREDLKYNLNCLDSIKERLPLYDEKSTAAPIENKTEPSSDEIFVVHGHDEAAKFDVARTLEKLGLRPVILNERANVGQTIIEKLTANSKVGFAVVILTPDDEGKSKKEQQLNPRARQNVIIELGYFLGLLGRKKVCPLYVEGVEIPSDFDGVVYVPKDTAGNWRFLLARELKAAGYNIDANKLLD